MAMTTDVKDELSRVVTSRVSARKAQVATILRFAGGLHIVASRVVIEAELDQPRVAELLRHEIADLYGHRAEMRALAPGGLRKTMHYVVRVVAGGDALARQTGLLDARGRPVRGLPPQIVAGSVQDAEAAWRGAFLVHGSLTEPGRSASLEVTCPGPEAALALVGSARRIGVQAKSREVRGADRVLIRDGEAIVTLLTRIGAEHGWKRRRSSTSRPTTTC